MARHELHASPATVHWGFFDAALPPVLEVDPGDEVVVHCLSARPEDLPPRGSFEVLPELLEVHERSVRGPGPHFMTGPIAVRGAKPGDVLEVRILACELRVDWGWMALEPLKGSLPE